MIELTFFPDSYQHPSIGQIPDWPEWAYYGGDPPRRCWLTRMGDRIYNVTEIAGQLPLYDDQDNICPQTIYYVGLVEMRQQDWGWAPAIVSYDATNEDDLAARREEIKRELERILTVHYL